MVASSVPLRYSPSRQSVQPLVTKFIILPAAQSEHLVLPLSEVRPSAQASHGTLRFFDVEKEFMRQSLQITAPAASLNWPGIQGKHDACPVSG